MVYFLVSIALVLGLGILVRRSLTRTTPDKVAADRAWLNSLTDANKQFAKTWFQ
jgi:hypothetical protein